MKLSATLCSALGHACQMCSLENAHVPPSAPALRAPDRSGMVVSVGNWGCAGTACGEAASSCLLADLAGVSKPSICSQTPNTLPAAPTWSRREYRSRSWCLPHSGAQSLGHSPTSTPSGRQGYVMPMQPAITFLGAAHVKGVPGQHRLLRGVACSSHNWTCGH